MTLPNDLAAMLDDLRPAAERQIRRNRRHRHLVLAAALACLVAAGCGAAYAAVRMLGDPAPTSIQKSLEGFAGAPFVEQPTLEAQTARLVAASADAALYGVDDVHDNYCLELVGAGHGLIYGVNCAFGLEASTARPSTAPIAFSSQTMYEITDDGEPPVVDYGRAPEGTVAAEAHLAGGASERLDLGIDRFYLYQPSPANQPAARRGLIQIDFLDAQGHSTGSWAFQPPLILRGEGTPLRRVTGRIEVEGARLVQVVETGIQPRSSRTTYVPVPADGRFEWTTTEPTQAMLVTVLGDRRRPLTQPASVLAEDSWRRLLERLKQH